MKRNQCSGCEKQFAGVTAFDAHRTGSYANKTRRCLSTETLLAQGWTTTTEKINIRVENIPQSVTMEVWHMPMSEQAKAYFASLRTKESEDE